jgi:hypothetical protein
MLTSIYFLLFSFLIILCILSFRYYVNKENIAVWEGVVNTGGEIERPNKLEDTKDLVFAFFDDMKMIIEKQLLFLRHWVLHFFVIILGFISDIFDYLYTRARDLFLKTATKEREVVAKFWPHLKEYKREKEEER